MSDEYATHEDVAAAVGVAMEAAQSSATVLADAIVRLHERISTVDGVVAVWAKQVNVALGLLMREVLELVQSQEQRIRVLRLFSNFWTETSTIVNQAQMDATVERLMSQIRRYLDENDEKGEE